MARKTKAELETELEQLRNKYNNAVEENTKLQTKLNNTMNNNDVVTRGKYDGMVKQFETDIERLEADNTLKDKEIKRLKEKVKLLESVPTADTTIADINNKLNRLIEVICVDKVSNTPNKVGRKKYDNIEVIERMKQLKNNGYGYQRIAKTLNNEGIMNNSNKPWSNSSIKYILDNN